jgi:L-aspartate oxidase
VISRLSADFLIVGSGIAGLRAAIELAPHGRVLVLTKADPKAGSTGYAQGGIAAAVGADDSPALHAADTVRAGDGLCDERAVDALVEAGPRDVRELVDWGAAFDRQPDGTLDLAREGAHSRRRVLHAHDATGREIGRVLARRLAAFSHVEIRDHAVAVQTIVEDGAVTGVRFFDREGALAEARGQATLLATGGAGQVYRETTNPDVASGDGVALAYLAGARVADLEFVQFHPTVLSVPETPRYLLSEALRGEGARLVNRQGDPFMERYEPEGDLAARDRVARAMVREAARTGAPVYLSMAHLPARAVHARFPAVADLCRRAGLDLARDPLPVSPAAHYLMGGVVTDLDGRSSLPGLFAAGEVAMTGVHGANRLASNSLLEGLVFGARAGRAMRAWTRSGWPGPVGRGISDRPPAGVAARPAVDEAALRDLMWHSAGVFRNRDGLTRAAAVLQPSWDALVQHLATGSALSRETWRLASLLTVSRLIVRAALRREESRGAHFRTDQPDKDDRAWRLHAFEERTSSVSVGT